MGALEKLGLDNLKENAGEYSQSQTQTQYAFDYKWSRRETYESESIRGFMKNWLIERYCNGNIENLDKLLNGGQKIIMDAGCGVAFSAVELFGDRLNENYYLGVDISDAVYIAKERFNERGLKGDFIKSSILDLPFPDETIDIIFSEGVLHHTDNTEESLRYLSKKLKRSGIFMFYVYAKKSVIREFTDDHIRNELRRMTDEEAWEAIKPLTLLGIELGKLNQKLNVPEDIPLLGIKKGEYDLQRFIYWNIFKAYYKSEFDLEEMNHINYDWYRPANCHRHTKEEIFKYCESASLEILHFNEQEAGFTVVAKKM